MNFIYFMETGDKLEDKLSGSKSKIKVFFEFVRVQSNWRFLAPYKDEIVKYDQVFRTPEVHKSSFLRAQMLRGEVSDANAQLNLLNRAMNNVWENVQSIVGGDGAVSFTDLHLIDDHEIDPQYLSVRKHDK
jgi:hypothetical protein